MLPGSQECRKPLYNAKQGASLFWAVVRTGTVSYWQRKPCQKNLQLARRIASGHITDLSVTEPDLEEIFLHYYAEGGDE